MPRLPVPGQDANVWGTVLNDFLSTEHNSDGTLKKAAQITAAQAAADAAQTAANAAQADATTALQAKQKTRGLCVYASGSYPARPTGFAAVEFVGPVDPNSLAQDNDTWVNTA